jgi:hypothetical protein
MLRFACALEGMWVSTCLSDSIRIMSVDGSIFGQERAVIQRSLGCDESIKRIAGPYAIDGQ